MGTAVLGPPVDDASFLGFHGVLGHVTRSFGCSVSSCSLAPAGSRPGKRRICRILPAGLAVPAVAEPLIQTVDSEIAQNRHAESPKQRAHLTRKTLLNSFSDSSPCGQIPQRWFCGIALISARFPAKQRAKLMLSEPSREVVAIDEGEFDRSVVRPRCHLDATRGNGVTKNAACVEPTQQHTPVIALNGGAPGRSCSFKTGPPGAGGPSN